MPFGEWNRDSGLRGGYINNNLVAEFYFSSIFIGYNFDSEYISSGMGRTFNLPWKFFAIGMPKCTCVFNI